MASFLDSPELLGRFNPYIQQLPIEALTQVGLEKQRRYDEGVQKIQSAIDRVVGLDIVRDVDKQYLKSKLESLGGDLKTVAASDFSNYQLTNQVAGMASRIGKDNNVVNAVASTSVYRKGVSDMNTAIKEGKSSPSNEYIFKDAANKWLSSTNLEDTFNENYLPYTEVTKPTIEIIKALTGDSTITDIAFDTDINGKITAVYDAVTRKKIAGLSPERIQTALISGLTPAQMKQLEIDGRYAYSNVNKDEFVQRVTLDYQNQKNDLLRKRKTIEDAKSATQSVDIKNQLDDKIAEIDKSLGRISKEYSSVANLVGKGSLESAKATLHSINYLNGISNSFAYTEASQTYESSPFADLAWKREQLRWDKEKFAAQHELDWYLAGLKAKEVENALKDKEGWGGFPGAVNEKDVDKVSMFRLQKSIEEDNKTLTQMENEFLSRQGKDKDWLALQRDKWEKSKSTGSAEIDNYFRKVTDIELKRRDNEILRDEIFEEVNKKYGTIYDKIPKEDRPVTVQLNGRSITYSPQEIVDFNEKFDKYKKVGIYDVGGGEPYLTSEYDDATAYEELDEKGRNLYEVYKRLDKGRVSSPSDLVIKSARDRYNNIVNKPHREQLQERSKEIDRLTNERLTRHQPVGYTITTTNPQQVDETKGFLQRVKVLSQNGEIAESPGYDSDILTGILEKDTDVTATISVLESSEFQAPPQYEITISGKSGTTSFRITDEQKRKTFGSRYEPSPEEGVVRKFQEKIVKNGGYTTSIDKGQTNISNARIKSYDFPAVKTFGISGNLITVDGLYQLKLNLYDPVLGKWIENIDYPRELVSDKTIGRALLQLDDKEIYRILYNGKIPTDEDLNNIRKLLSDPLNGK